MRVLSIVATLGHVLLPQVTIGLPYCPKPTTWVIFLHNRLPIWPPFLFIVFASPIRTSWWRWLPWYKGLPILARNNYFLLKFYLVPILHWLIPLLNPTWKLHAGTKWGWIEWPLQYEDFNNKSWRIVMMAYIQTTLTHVNCDNPPFQQGILPFH